jgi:TRAP-type C4-dicarboxylate transport system substrate-binding protein
VCLSRHAVLGVLMLLSLAVASPVAAAEKPLLIKLATIAPRGSSYHQSLEKMRQDWQKISDGKVQVVIYPDGTQGSEADTVGLMQTRSLQASLLTVVGLADIEPDVGALQNLPMAFRSLEEVDYVGEHLQPRLEKSLASKGYLVLFWTDSGWIRFFTKQPVSRPEDLRKLKIFAWAGSAQQADLWKSAGVTPVSLETANIGQALMSGTISAVPVPPIFALFGQLYTDLGKAKYMLEINWAPLVGALVVRKEALDKLPEATRAEMIKIAAEAGKSIKLNGRAENEKAVEAMVKRGLTVTRLTPETEAEWRATAEKAYPKIRGDMVPADVFDEAMKLIQEYRRRPANK